MKRLAIDTSSVACTVALQIDDEVFARHEEQEREHTRLLMPMIREVLGEAGNTIEQLDAIVLGNGPGSFIGMRIATSVAQGLAHGADLGIIPVSSLAAVAAAVIDATSADHIAVAQDAHMNEIYLGLFSKGNDGLPSLLAPERLQGHNVIPELSTSEAWTIAGYGWQRYPEIRALNSASIEVESDILFPDARYLLRFAETCEPIAPRDVEPAYLRQKVAERPA